MHASWIVGGVRVPHGEGSGGWTSGSLRTRVFSADPGVSLCPKVPPSAVPLQEESSRGAQVSFPCADIDERKTTYG